MTTNFADPDSYPVDNRAVTYSLAFFSAKHLGAGQFYLMTLKDAKGNKLDGGTTYRLRVPASAPVHQYWSATAYDGKTHALIRNTPRSSRSSTSPDLAVERRRLGRHLFRSRGTRRRIVELGSDQGLQHFRGDLPVLRTGSSAVRQDLEAAGHREASLTTRRSLPGTTAAGGSTATAPARGLHRAAPEPVRYVRPCGPDPTTARRPAMAPPTRTTCPPCRGAASRAGSAENSPLLVTRTGLPSPSSTSTGSSSSTVGEGSGSCPGHG